MDDHVLDEERTSWFSVEHGLQWLRRLRQGLLRVATAGADKAWSEEGNDEDPDDWDDWDAADGDDEVEKDTGHNDEKERSVLTLAEIASDVDAEMLEVAVEEIDGLMAILEKLREGDVRWGLELE